MSRFALGLLVTLAWPATFVQAERPTLVLKAPSATAFGHRIEFVGRVIPAVRGARIRLYRGRVVVAVVRTRGDGTFRIPVRLGRPGPFRTVWRDVASNEVSVRIHPRLRTFLAGPRVVGARLTLVARLQPREAGTLRVRVLRDGRPPFLRVVRSSSARIALATADLRAFRVRVDTVPRPGYAARSRELAVRLRPPLLSLGSRGPVVTELARRLAALRYAVRGSPRTFDADLLQSVYAFQKAQSLPRTGVVGPAFWARLQRPLVPTARYRTPAEHLEVDKARQLLYVVRGGSIVLIVPVSTAGIPGYFTPVGRFAIYRKVPGIDPSPLGILYKPMYFTGGYAIHGNPSVPPYPASHGCVRVPNFVIERLFVTEPYGETVYVY